MLLHQIDVVFHLFRLCSGLKYFGQDQVEVQTEILIFNIFLYFMECLNLHV